MDGDPSIVRAAGVPTGVTCARCGYDLRMLGVGGACPECGLLVAESIAAAGQARERLDLARRRRLFVGAGLLAATIGLLVFAVFKEVGLDLGWVVWSGCLAVTSPPGCAAIVAACADRGKVRRFTRFVTYVLLAGWMGLAIVRYGSAVVPLGRGWDWPRAMGTQFVAMVMSLAASVLVYTTLAGWHGRAGRRGLCWEGRAIAIAFAVSVVLPLVAAWATGEEVGMAPLSFLRQAPGVGCTGLVYVQRQIVATVFDAPVELGVGLLRGWGWLPVLGLPLWVLVYLGRTVWAVRGEGIS